MITYIRQTASEIRYSILETVRSMLIQPIVFEKKKKGDEVIYTWVPGNQTTTLSTTKTKAPESVNAEVYMPKTLHVEDNAEIRSIVKYFLKRTCDLQFAETGEAALELAKVDDFDVIIMDINLGEGMDGIETARQIRKIDRYANVPIIAITANLASNVREDCLEVGMDAFLPKPFRREDLVNTINFVIERRSTSI